MRRRRAAATGETDCLPPSSGRGRATRELNTRPRRAGQRLIDLVHSTELGLPPAQLPERARRARHRVLDRYGLTTSSRVARFCARGCRSVVRASDDCGIPDRTLALLLGVGDDPTGRSADVIRAIDAYRAGPRAFDDYLESVTLSDRCRLATEIYDLRGRISLVGWAPA